MNNTNIIKKQPKHTTNKAVIKSLRISASTQDFLEIEEIIYGIIATKNGRFMAVIEVFPTNFELLSQSEQEYKIKAFASLINSLDFNLQIVIDTKKLFVSEYTNFLNKIDITHHPPGLQRMFKIYKQFITNIITHQNVFKKRFFMVIPYASGFSYSISMPLDKKQHLLEQAINYLNPKITHLINMVKSMGLEAKQLRTLDLVKYFYEVYNPGKDVIPIEGNNIEIN